MTFWDKLALAVRVLNEASGGTLLWVYAGLWVFVIVCALISLAQEQGGDRG